MFSKLALARNLTLPALPFWAARSFYAQLLMVLTVLANAAGIDLMGYFSAMGLGSTHDEVLANGDKFVSAWQQIAPLVFGFWAWIERRAPNYRISVPKKATTAGLGLFLIGLLLVAPDRASAGQPLCMPHDQYVAMLADRYGEVPVWSGTSGSYQVQLLQAASGSWTLLMIREDAKACNITGGDMSDFAVRKLAA